MIITPDYVLVHLSKTGGSFVEETLKDYFCPSIFHRKIHGLKRRYQVKIPFYNYAYHEKHQHAICNDIPEKETHKDIVSCIRNPYNLYVSEYTFGWWKTYKEKWFYDHRKVVQKYPKLLDFDFQQFVEVSWKYCRWMHDAIEKYPEAQQLGWYTHKFVYYYCKDHDYVFSAADNLDLFIQRVKESMYDVHFMRTENLNNDLYDFLISKGYGESEMKYILNKEKIVVSKKEKSIPEYYTLELEKEVRRKEALIFTLFPEYDE